MKIEDYFKYYIQGSDHYLIPKDVFEELFNEMQNWKNESQISQNNWNGLKDWLVEMINEIKTNDIYDRTEYECTQIATLESTLAKVEEIESRK